MKGNRSRLGFTPCLSRPVSFLIGSISWRTVYRLFSLTHGLAGFFHVDFRDPCCNMQ